MLRTLSKSRRRSSFEIVAEILRLARKGARRTRVVYGANLNFKMLDEYLTRLEETGLITLPQNGDQMIRTTEKGKEFLQQFYGLKEFGID